LVEEKHLWSDLERYHSGLPEKNEFMAQKNHVKSIHVDLINIAWPRSFLSGSSQDADKRLNV